MLGIVDSQRDSYLRGSNHIDGGLVALEYLEHLPQESVGQQHTARFDLNGRDVLFGSDRLDFTISTFGVVVYQRPGGIGLHRVEQPHRYVVQFGRQHTCGVQNLGSEIG